MYFTPEQPFETGITSNRRDILKQMYILGAGAVPLVQTARTMAATTGPRTGTQAVQSIAQRGETIMKLGGMGFGYQSTWATDDRQFMMVN